MSWDLDRLCLEMLAMLTVYKGIVEHGKYLYTYMKSSIAVSSAVRDIPQSRVSEVKMADGVL